MAKHFPLEDLGQCGTILEQILSHDDHNSYRPLSRWVNHLSSHFSALGTGGFRHCKCLLGFWPVHWPFEICEAARCETPTVGTRMRSCNRTQQLWKYNLLLSRRRRIEMMVLVMIFLFSDAVREVRKYSGKDLSKDAKLQPNMYDHMHMKLFRAQRNLYISGFAVFLWLWVLYFLNSSLLDKIHIPSDCSPFNLLWTLWLLCSVMKRVVTLINQLASVSSTTAALQAQADNANQAAKKYMEDNELLKQVI